jgi:hypothetical protein
MGSAAGVDLDDWPPVFGPVRTAQPMGATPQVTTGFSWQDFALSSSLQGLPPGGLRRH